MNRSPFIGIQSIMLSYALPNILAGSSHDTHATDIEVRQCKYLNNNVEQDHRNVKRRIRSMLGYKLFWTARVVLAGIELVHMIKKGQMRGGLTSTTAIQFYSLAF